jgi:hypothetical protein
MEVKLQLESPVNTEAIVAYPINWPEAKGAKGMLHFFRP